ncbi:MULTISPECIES: hypothetical protein [Gammaproteobacteria]|uniref:hypothetical protein n=1 Tax=Gammaproteobacteria TaxID=1236 RepID=UPI0018681774|nr:MULTISPECIES: hypothetical protein [Gammaproteobacteria]
MENDKVEIKVVGKGILMAFWIGLLIVTGLLIYNELSPHSNSGGWSSLSRAITSVFIIFSAGFYCLICFFISLNEWLSCRKNECVNVVRTKIAMILHGIVALIVGVMALPLFLK